jgi:uncharacterized lipoprotein YajG
MKVLKFWGVWGMAAATLLGGGCQSPVSSETQVDPQLRLEITNVIDSLFAGMARKDSALLRQVMVPTTSIHRVQLDSSGVQKIHYVSGESFRRAMTNTGFEQREESWDMQVQVNENLATVIAPYRYDLNGVFAHCGVNQFGLIKGKEGWRIHSLEFSITSRDSAECGAKYPRKTTGE